MTKGCKAAHFTGGGFLSGLQWQAAPAFLLMMCFALDKKMLRWFSQHLLIIQSQPLLPSELQVQTLKCRVMYDSTLEPGGWVLETLCFLSPGGLLCGLSREGHTDDSLAAASPGFLSMNAFWAGLQSTQGSSRETYRWGAESLLQVQIPSFECTPLAHSPRRELPMLVGSGGAWDWGSWGRHQDW